MDHELEAIGKQGPQHFPHLLPARLCLGLALDVEAFGVDPVRAPHELLHGEVGEAQHAAQRHVDADVASGLGLACCAEDARIENDVLAQERAGDSPSRFESSSSHESNRSMTDSAGTRARASQASLASSKAATA